LSDSDVEQIIYQSEWRQSALKLKSELWSIST